MTQFVYVVQIEQAEGLYAFADHDQAARYRDAHIGEGRDAVLSTEPVLAGEAVETLIASVGGDDPRFAVRATDEGWEVVDSHAGTVVGRWDTLSVAQADALVLNHGERRVEA